MTGYPIEKQVCSLEQAKDLAELLGDGSRHWLVVRRFKTESQAKCALAIQGLRESWIKRKEFRYA